MKMRKMLMVLLAAVVLFSQTAFAGSKLSAVFNAGVLEINWNAEGRCVLTVYRNDWPVSVSYVDGESGGTEIQVRQAGKYSVRLSTPDWCEKVNAGITGTDLSTMVPVMKPTQAPATPAPTKVPSTPDPTVMPIATPAATVPAQSGQSMTSMASQVVSMVNEERARYGLEPLSVDAQLTAAACVRAKEIVEKFSHTRPDGASWSTVSSAARGENIARGQSTADRVMSAWMTSEGHRANILRESFGSIGVCALQVNGVIHWVQLFGK